jgi:protein phosphatase
MRFLPGNAQHIGARHSQQDSFGFSDPGDADFTAHAGFVAIVCDGMGGMEFGDEASRLAVRVFLEAYARKTREEAIPAALERSVRETNAEVVALAKRLGMKDGVGTTLVAAALHDRYLYYISVGDSGVFLAAPGEFRMINHPHVFANVLDAAVARGTMSREDAQTHPERESLTSYIGAAELEEVDFNTEPYPLHEGDTVLLASDGMFKTLTPEEIRACLAGDPQRWPEILVAQTIAHNREYQDNVTVLSVTATERLPATVSLRPEKPAPAPATLASQPALEWPTGEHAAVPTPPSKVSVWWIVTLALVLIAAGAAGWYYATHIRPATPSGSTKKPLPSDPAVPGAPPATGAPSKDIDLPTLRREPQAPGDPQEQPPEGVPPQGAPGGPGVPGQSIPGLPPPVNPPGNPAPGNQQPTNQPPQPAQPRSGRQ